MSEAVAPDFSGRQLGNWLLLRRLGAGSFGAVYEAQNQVIDQQAAVKVLHPHLALNQDLLRRFVNEASAAAKARHPGVVLFFDGGTSPEGLCYVVMELLRGQPLDQVLSRGPLPPARVAHLGARLADALQAVHSRGIVHRDLKPENIFLLDASEDAAQTDTPKILDFGIAKLRTSAKQTTDGTLLGTLMYMSPEQCQTLPDIDARADIYSLGMILYECLSGGLPFQEETAHGWLFAHIAKPVPDLAARCPGAPPGLCQLLTRMLAKERADRPGAMSEVRDALQTFTASEQLPTSRSPSQTAPASLPPAVLRARPEAATTPLPAPAPQRTSASSMMTPSVVSTPSRRGWLLVAGLATVAVVIAGAALNVGSTTTRPRRPAEPAPAPLKPREVPGAALSAPPKAPRRAVAPLPAALRPQGTIAIGRAQVTIGDFHEFVTATGATRPGKWPWEFKVAASLPMNGVPPEQAGAYCRWRYPDRGGRLPSAAELGSARAATDPKDQLLNREWSSADQGTKGNVNTGFRCAAAPQPEDPSP